MNVQNPLLISPPASPKRRNYTGRPCANKSIRFSQQPTSIVSQILKKMISENKVTLPIEQSNSEIISSSPAHLFEDENSFSYIEDVDQNVVTYQKPKKTCVNNCKEETKPKTYYCDYLNCTYSTKLSSNLQKHKRIHTGEKPFLCDRCSFRTNFSNSLKVHRRLHTEERPYLCTYCDYRCNSISNLKKHCHTRHKDNTNQNIT